MLKHRIVDRPIGRALAAAKSTPVNPRRRSWVDDVGLQRGKTSLDDLLAQRGDIVEPLDRRHTNNLVVSRPGGPAVGPVHALAVSHRPPKQLIDRDAKRFSLNVP